MTHRAEHQQLWIILLVVFIGFLGTSVAYPIFPPLFLHPDHNQIIPDTWSVSAKSILLGFALAAYPLGQFIGSPIIGGCSDRYGRKNILMLSLLVSAFGYFLTAISLQFNWLWMLLLSRFFTGVVEGNLGLVRAMAVDLQGINKYKSLGRVNGVSAIGYVIGPLIGGFFSDSSIVPWFSFALPFYLAMACALIALVLGAFKLYDQPRELVSDDLTIWQRFNFIARFKYLFQVSPQLKSIIIISTIYTFAVDIFYEFSPVYLTGYWSMTPGGIAIYNAGLSFALSVGASWLPHYLTRYYSTDSIIIFGMLATAVFLGLMVIFPQKLLVWFLFALIGFAIATVNTSTVVRISNIADKTIQGEAMGTQLGLRMLGDAILCSTFGFLIISSVRLPLAISSVVALLAMVMYINYQLRA